MIWMDCDKEKRFLFRGDVSYILELSIGMILALLKLCVDSRYTNVMNN